MNKIAIIYISKYGSTKQYAQILQKQLKADMVENKHINISVLTKYETLIFIGPLMGTAIKGIKTLQKHYYELKDKNIFVLGVGATHPDYMDMGKLQESNINNELENIPIYYARGQWNFAAMSWMDKVMCSMMRKGLLKKEEKDRTEFDRQFLELFYETNNWVSVEGVQPLIDRVKEKTA